MWGESRLRAKGKPYTPSVRVPLMASWPGRIPAGVSDGRLAANIDVAPTILEAVGLPAVDMDGRSLLSTPPRARLLLEASSVTSRVPKWASTRTASYQYTEYYDRDTGEISFREYYDLLDDPWQLDNLYADADPFNDPPAATTASLSAELARDRRCGDTPGAEPCP
jgi:arylsulfatase A-like enzyme